MLPPHEACYFQFKMSMKNIYHFKVLQDHVSGAVKLYARVWVSNTPDTMRVTIMPVKWSWEELGYARGD